MQEKEIVELCRKCDLRGQKELYERYAPRLLTICLRYSGNRATAQDLLHDAFIKIFNSFGKFDWRGEGSLRAWSEKICVNLCLEYLRKNKKIFIETANDMIPDTYDEPSVNEVMSIPQNVVMEMIRNLPDGYRTVFNLYTFENKSHREIAAILGINEKSSSSQLSRAKKILATKIKMYSDAVNREK